VHSAHCGHPVAGDEKYGDREADAKLKAVGLRRMFLHAYTLSFARPDASGEFSVTAPLPEELENVLARLREPRSKAVGNDAE
jgi:23S rRNA pseudouridine955/2504/2580 synthase